MAAPRGTKPSPEEGQKQPAAEPAPPVAQIVHQEEAASMGHVEVSVPKVWRPSKQGRMARRAALVAIALIVLVSPALVQTSTNLRAISLAMIYVIVGLSINILMGYAGQISLGHQAFVGVGAFTAALTVTKYEAPFLLGLIMAGVIGAISAFLLGIVALRLKGLYLALITLAYGSVAELTIFATPSITGGGAGVNAVRPTFIASERAFVYFSMVVVVLALYIDWRLVKSKVGRAIFAIRENELAAASFGINVTSYKLIAFIVSGIFAGVAGALFGFRVESVDAANFDFALGLTFVLMAVVGGLGSRVGVFVGSAFFAILDLLIHSLFGSGVGHWLADVPFINKLEEYPGFIGALLLLMTLTLYPGGIAQQMKPITGWLGGKRLKAHGSTTVIREGGAGVRP